MIDLVFEFISSPLEILPFWFGFRLYYVLSFFVGEYEREKERERERARERERESESERERERGRNLVSYESSQSSLCLDFTPGPNPDEDGLISSCLSQD